MSVPSDAVKQGIHLQKALNLLLLCDSLESMATQTTPVSVFGLLPIGGKSFCVDTPIRKKKS
jgi:hypothetical protein